MCISFDMMIIWKPVISVCAVSSKYSVTLTFCQQHSLLLHFLLVPRSRPYWEPSVPVGGTHFWKAFWSLLIHMNEPRRPASLLLSPAEPLGGDEIRQSRQTYQAKGSYTEPTEKKAHEWTHCPSQAHYPVFSCSLPILFCVLAGTDNLCCSGVLDREGDGIWLSILSLLSLLSLMIQVLLGCDAVLAACCPTFRRNLIPLSPTVQPLYVKAWTVKSANLETSIAQSCY